MYDEIVLLSLLEEYLVVKDMWDDYYTKGANKGFGPGQERAQHALIQDKHMSPLMERCRKEGVQYSLLLDILPGAFKTTAAQRWRIFDELLEMVRDKRNSK